MVIIKPWLIIYIVLVMSKIVPSMHIHNTMLIFILTSAIVLVSYTDPTLAVILLTCLVLNIDFDVANTSSDQLLESYRLGLDEFRTSSKPNRLRLPEESVVVEEKPIINNAINHIAEQPLLRNEPAPPQKKMNHVACNHHKHPKVEACDKRFIISQKMLSDAQTNIYDKKHVNMIPNETRDPNVNIQGTFDDVSGFNW